MINLEAKVIISKFGGLVEMSRKTGVPVSTIQHWKRTNNIPCWRWDFINQKANEHNIILGGSDE